MKNLLLSFALIGSLATFAQPLLARQNPAVQPIFFENLQASLPAAGSQRPDLPAGDVSDLTLSQLALVVADLQNDPVPLIVEFYSSDPAACAITQSTGANECQAQASATEAAAAQYPGRVRFVRIDVKNYPILLNGPDVRVLPSHIVIASYLDTTHYSAFKVSGYLSLDGLQSLIQSNLSIT